jgi:hypothetical protein
MPVAAAALPGGNMKKLNEGARLESTPASSTSLPGPVVLTPAVRHNFPETWLWADTNIKFGCVGVVLCHRANNAYFVLAAD